MSTHLIDFAERVADGIGKARYSTSQWRAGTDGSWWIAFESDNLRKSYAVRLHEGETPEAALRLVGEEINRLLTR